MRIVPFDDDVQGGATIEDMIELCKLSKAAGVDAIDLSRGNSWGVGSRYIVAPMDIPKGFNVEYAAKIRKETNMIVICAGRINDPQQADDIISSGAADMVDIGRAQIIDPEFCNKSREGRTEELLRCSGCNMGCMDRCHNPEFPHISCLWNPSVAQERAFAIKPADNPKKILVIGGGPAGMESAITLSKRGHKVVLAEKSEELGGALILGSYAPRKEDMLTSIQARARHVAMADVDIRLNTMVTPELIAELKPDEIVIATGGTPITMNLPGIDKENVCGYEDVLTGVKNPSGRISVIGGGLVGLETAEFLAKKGGNKITVVEMLPQVGAGLGNARKACILMAMHMEGIEQIVNAKAVEIKDKSLIVEKDGVIEEIPSDYVVVAVGVKPMDSSQLTKFCEDNEIPYHIIGDASKAAKAIDAIAQAAELARKI